MTLTTLFGGCFSPKSPLEKHERILFSTIGNQPFRDYVFSIRTDGRDLKPLLVPNPTTSYMFASARSLSGPIVVKAHELVAGEDRTEDRLYVYIPDPPQWRPLLKQHPALEGSGIISPDGTQVVYVSGEVRGSGETGLRIANLQTGESRELFGEKGGRAVSPSWGASGNVAFVRAVRSPRGLFTELMQIPGDGGEPTRLLAPDAGVSCVAYGRDAQRVAVWTKRGIEILTLADGERVLVFERNHDSYIFRSWGIGGIAWSRRSGEIAFALENRKTKKSELWIVSEDGTNPRVIYSMKEGSIVVSDFVE